MRFEDVKLENLDFTYGNPTQGSFEVVATNELVEIFNRERERQGNYDLVEVENDNDVYYNFYLIFDANTAGQGHIKLYCVCNNGEKDDKAWYETRLLPEEEEMLAFKAIQQMAEELLKKED